MKLDRRFSLVAGLALVAMIQTAATAQEKTDAVSWNRFRGPNGQGVVAENKSIPSKWKKGSNIAWEAELEGLGSSSPIVVGDSVFLTSYTGFGIDKKEPGSSKNLKRHLICLDKKSGKKLWDKTVEAKGEDDPYKGFIQEHGYASCTPTSDGKLVFVNFGRAGLFAFDMKGKQVWRQDLGNLSDPRKWGLGASPVLVGDVLIVNCGNVDRSIKAFDAKTGKPKWTVKNEKFANSWSTPVLVKVDGKEVIVFNMPATIYGFEPSTGKELWNTPSPVSGTACASLAQSGTVLVTMGGRAGLAGAIDCAKTSEGEDGKKVRKVLWNGRLRAGIGTPILLKESILWHSRGILYRANRKDGELVESIRLPGAAKKANPKQRPKASYASLVAVGDRVFLTSDSGTVFVYQLTDELELLETNQFSGDNGRFSGTPAIDGERMFFRAEKKVYCISGLKKS